MDESKTINKDQEINKYPIVPMNIAIKGNIIYVTSSEKNDMFILTDSNDSNFYIIENGKEKDIKSYLLKSEINLETSNFQTENKESQIWCDKLGTHVIIKYKNAVFYYNPFMKGKVKEMILCVFGNIYLQPYSVAFNDDFYDPEKTGKILFSDYNSDIYQLQIELNDNKELVHFYGPIFKFVVEKVEKGEDDEDEIFDFFEMEKDDRILDMKLIISKSSSNLGESSSFEGKNIFILAITKRILFQFSGKNSFEDVFANYKLENGKILKAYKRFISGTKKDFKYSRIQLINEASLQEEKPPNFIIGFMSQCGYMMGKINMINPEPQKSFRVIEFYKPKKDQKDELIRSAPKMVCQSINHIFFLHHDYLVIQNKLTNRIIYDKYLVDPYLDMYYNHILNGIIIYNEKGIYKIPLDNEFKYLYEDYIEIGNYESALDLTKEEKKIRPKLHKLYADYLFEKKQYIKAADEYAFSNEIFEHVCMKFLKAHDNLGLIRYLTLIRHFRLKEKLKANNNTVTNSKENEENKENEDKYFIEKYLINTWLLELLVGKDENDKQKINLNLKTFGRDKEIRKHLDKILLYFMLSIYGKNEDLLLEFANLIGDYQKVILTSIDYENIKDSLQSIENNLSTFSESENLKKIYYNYSNIFFKNSPKETYELLKDYFIFNVEQEKVIKLLISPNFVFFSKDEDNFKLLIEFIHKLINAPFKNNSNEVNFKKNQNLHNLFVLLLSYKSDSYQNLLKEYLMHYITMNSIKLQKISKTSEKIYFDLYFAKKIFEKKNNVNDKMALCLIDYLLKQYNESIDIALENNLTEIENNQQKEIIYLLAENIPDVKLRKKIWIKIFEFKKNQNKLSEAKDIINKSKHLIKIEDILPLMGDEVKVNEFKNELNECIKNYEKNKRSLTQEIKYFNESNDSIKKDIDISEQKAIKIKYTQLRCIRCGKNIKSSKFFMFPCQHIFDVECLIESYNEFEKNKLGDQKFEQKVKVINALSNKINSLKEKKQKSIEYEQRSKEAENFGTLQKIKTIKSLLSKEFQKVQFSVEEECMLNDTIKILYNYLDEECLLCGQEMINSTQIDFGDENDLEWDI